VGNMVANHLLCADDLRVFGPSLSGLQRLLNFCCDYAAESERVFNCNKAVGVVFSLKKSAYNTRCCPKWRKC